MLKLIYYINIKKSIGIEMRYPPSKCRIKEKINIDLVIMDKNGNQIS